MTFKDKFIDRFGHVPADFKSSFYQDDVSCHINIASGTVDGVKYTYDEVWGWLDKD